MRPFEFHTADTESHAVELLATLPRGRFLAGGTTLVDLMKHDVERPAHLIDINGLALSRIEELPDGSVRVGALVRNSDMAHHPLIAGRFPMLSQALLSGASPQLRNMATTGGNLLQRTRCSYFRDTATACNKREPGTGCSARGGYNRNHAILGGSEHCIATHPSDMAVPLVALDAVVRVRGPRGDRGIPMRDFHLLPGDHPEVETSLAADELIVAVDIPALPFAVRSAYTKVRDRASYAFALTSAAVALDVSGGEIRDARIALGGVGTKPWRVPAAEERLRGERVSSAVFQRAADAAVEGAVPHEYNAFKIELARRTVMRTLARVSAQA